MRIPMVSCLSFILCCFWIFLCFNISVALAHCLEDQKSLLLQLKNNLIFRELGSTKLVSWNLSLACCDWIGVSCDEEGHVTDLDLSEESISGGFDNSSSIFSFQYLQRLNLAWNNFNSVIPSELHKLKSLTYLNLSYAGFVGHIPIEISQLTRLVTLDISSLSYLTGIELKLENPNLRMLIRNLTSIRQLYLDGVTISSQGKELCNALLSLPSLQELSMLGCNLSGPIDSSLARLKNLSVIRLGMNNLSTTVPGIFGTFSNLVTLDLSSCGLSGNFPKGIFQKMTLTFIDISYNAGLQGSLPDFAVNGSLQTLIVSNTNFSGDLPDSVSNLRNLSTLDLSSSQFFGTLPNSISQLTELTYLDLSINNFKGPIPSFGRAKKLTHLCLSHNVLSGVISSSSFFEGLQSLVSVDLRNNSISGSIPSSLFTLPLLQSIDLSFNKFSQLDEFSSMPSTILNILDLSSNNLAGPIPPSVFQLRRLHILQLSSNNFNGSMRLDVIVELQNLTTLDLSYNNLSIIMHENVTDAHLSSFPNILNLKLASCNLKTFPAFSRYLSTLVSLDLSNNHIQGTIPNWIWKLEHLTYLNLSHNLLTDLERPFQNPGTQLLTLDLHSNQLQGSIPFFPTSAMYLDYSSNKFSSVVPYDIGDYLSLTIFLSLSNNSLHGSITHSICNASSLLVLDLSNNNFSGTIPPCLMTMTETLGVLTLQKNNLTGDIPDKFPSLCTLRTLDLSENKLDGPIPKSLSKCSTLEVLDLANNQILDGFPCWLKNISTLRVLVLRQNKFQGPIGCPNTNDTWLRLQITDLAFNNFTGKLPGKSFTTWEGMLPNEAKTLQFMIMELSNIYYQDTVIITSKGVQMKLVKILTIFTAMDFSSNHLEGPIPEEMMNFKALYILNLSNNALTGRIPSSIENLRNLESLDLSNNALSGNIPTQITMLSFLSFLDVSFNNLVGNIPTGTQIQSFPDSSFIGNKGLCGPPLIQSCKNNVEVEGISRPSKGSINWNLISVELGFAFGIGTFILVLVFWKAGRKWYWKNVDDLLCIMFPRHLHLEYECHGGKMYRTLRWKAH